MRKKLVCFLFLVIGGLILAKGVLAQLSIGISPLTFELTANPGDVVENYLKVYNPSSDTTIKIGMVLEDIAPTGETGHVVVEPAETETYSLAKWIKVEPAEFDLNPKEEKFIKFTIEVPENAEPGGRYGTVIAGAKGVMGPAAVGAAIAPRVGALVLLTVPGVMKEELVVKSFATLRKYFEHGPISFEIRFENLGTVHVRPTGYVTVTNWLGQKVGDAEISPRNVLPGAVRKFEASLPEKWLFAGKYTATLTGSYGLSNIPLTPTVITFWAFPWKIGLGLLIVIILFILSRKRWLAAFRILIKGEKH
ncbi:MAG: hypothetical protein NT012_01500 [Candidatus Nealsonbacteria bacterium]|nr:hypothetical protein [Candidatus Nealsonbacteria bacterium]